MDEGPRDAAPVLLINGEPTWSYLYRHMIPPLVAAGRRVVAPDLMGFGRFDKPTERSDYTYQAYVDRVLQGLDLPVLTILGRMTRSWPVWKRCSRS